MLSTLYHLHALSPLHLGTGQGIGVIDLPIAREKASGLPIVPGSSMKGVLREELRPAQGDRALWRALFGPDPGDRDKARFEGALAVGDARLLCLPVRSFKGSWVWVSAATVLNRYQRDLTHIDPNRERLAYPQSIPRPATEATILAPGTSSLRVNSMIFLEDLDLHWEENAVVEEWGAFIGARVFSQDSDSFTWFQDRFAVVHDEVFACLIENGMEIQAHIQLDPTTHTVQNGPWYEEAIPAEALLWGSLALSDSRSPEIERRGAQTLLTELPDYRRLQVGGNATTGRGQVQWHRERSVDES